MNGTKFPWTRNDPRSWDYDGAGLLESSEDEDAIETLNTFDTYKRGVVSRTVEGVGTDLARSYVSVIDAAGNTTGVRDALGYWTRFTFDAVGQVARATDALGFATRAVYDVAGQTTDTFDQHGAKTHYTYNMRGWLDVVTDAKGNTTDNDYNASGDLTTFTDQNTEDWLTDYDELHRVKQTTDPEGNDVNTIYWADGQVKEIEDARNITTRFNIDWDNLKTVTKSAFGLADEQDWTETFDKVGFVTQTEDGEGHKVTYVPDALHRVEEVKNDSNVKIADYTYNEFNQVTAFEDGEGKITNYVFDIFGRAKSVEDPNSNITKGLYDANNRQVATIDAKEQVSRTVYDALGRVTKTIDANGGITRYRYDARGNLISLTDSVGNVTKWHYNEINQKVKEVDPRGEERTWTYTPAGQVDTYTDRNGRFKQYTYYANGWLHTEVWKTTPGGGTVNTITWTYNENGQWLTVVDNAGTYTRTYDDLGRLETQTDIHGKVLTYHYDNANRLDYVTDSEGGTRTYDWDNDNLLRARMFDDGTNELRIEYDYNLRGQVTEIRRYADLAATTLVSKTNYVYYANGTVDTITHRDGTLALVDDFDYDYDELNRVTQETSNLGPTRNYDYDPTSQLLDDGTENWTYDANGNRTLAGYSTSTGNRLDSDGVWNYTYDDEGNQISATKIVGGEVWLYTYDHNNRLTKAEHKPSGVGAVDGAVEYGYDVFGRLIQRSLDADGAGAGAAVVEKFAYEGRNAWADLDNAGSLTTRRVSGDSIDEHIARIDSNGVAWYLTDRLGSIRDIVDSAGALIDHIDYTSFGLKTETTPASGDRMGFTGQEHDSFTGLNNFDERWQNPRNGTFQQQDPIGFAGGLTNLNGYVGNNPTNSTDPTGLQFVLVTDFQGNSQQIYRSTGPYVGGAVRIGFGLMEGAAAVMSGGLLAPLIGAHALDNINAGIQTIANRSHQQGVTERLIDHGLQAIGVSPNVSPLLAGILDGYGTSALAGRVGNVAGAGNRLPPPPPAPAVQLELVGGGQIGLGAAAAPGLARLGGFPVPPVWMMQVGNGGNGGANPQEENRWQWRPSREQPAPPGPGNTAPHGDIPDLLNHLGQISARGATLAEAEMVWVEGMRLVHQRGSQFPGNGPVINHFMGVIEGWRIYMGRPSMPGQPTFLMGFHVESGTIISGRTPGLLPHPTRPGEHLIRVRQARVINPPEGQ